MSITNYKLTTHRQPYGEPQPHPCPSCGHCPTCGRQSVPDYYPPFPTITPPWWEDRWGTYCVWECTTDCLQTETTPGEGQSD